jgi:hypothetical protein
MTVTRVGASSRGVKGGGMIVGDDFGLNDDLAPSVVGVMVALGIMRMRRGKEGRILGCVLARPGSTDIICGHRTTEGSVNLPRTGVRIKKNKQGNGVLTGHVCIIPPKRTRRRSKEYEAQGRHI